ncbi:MAG: Eco57I restriction-modification methylase domain-containing protein, partial [Candidatus Kapaibacteriales bacterium]
LIYDIVNSTGKRTWSNFRRFTYFVSKEQTNKTFIRQMETADFSSLDKIKDAFSVEKVTEEFFEAYKYALRNVIIPELKNNNVMDDKKHSFAQQLLSRILFIYFLQRKAWFKWKNYVQDTNYIKNFWLKYKELLKQKKINKDTFYLEWLCSLFFGAFNKKSNLISNNLPDEIKESLNLMPFLNGGLFSKNELDELNFKLPDTIFEWLFEPDELSSDKNKGFLETFNFTINEASFDDADVAVDPEILGKVYESLILEEERSGAGIFYTPRIEIDFMCRKSLVEYLKQTNIPEEKIVKFIFEPHNKTHTLTKEQLGTIKNYLNNVRIVDPAVGSASFLVGIMNILVELHSELTEQLENKEENIFALKQKIILNNLYGVDVKDWAVMVGELRLWLSLVIETDEKYMDIYTKPLLPNLSFKIRQGDSLVQEIAGMPIYLRNEITGVPANIKTKLNELVDKKAAFFSSGRSADLKELKEIELFEQEIFKNIISLKIEQLNKELKSLNDTKEDLEQHKQNLFGEKVQPDKEKLKSIKSKIDFTQQQIEKYSTLLKTIGSKKSKDYFLWEIDFVEIFSLNNGFDIVIGNPPYVRQELIAPPLEHQQNYTDNQWREIKYAYKEKLIQAIKSTWEKDSIKLKIDKKSDLYVYFYYQSLSLLKPGGIFCFINSNSWLDVGYGAGLQEFLLKHMQPLTIIDNIAKRSFKQADVNTVIVFIKRPEQKPENYTLRFIAFKKPFEEVINTINLLTIEQATAPVFDNADYRIYPKTKTELLSEGVEFPEEDTELNLTYSLESLPYIGNKWGGKYLRAPEIYFKILEKGKDKLVRLGDIAEVRFGIKTGANKFFYLKP